MKISRLSLLLIAFLILLFAGCMKGDLLPGENNIPDNEEDITSGKGTLKLYLTVATAFFFSLSMPVDNRIIE